MGILGTIKNKVFGRGEEDYSDIKSNVLGEPPELISQGPPPPDMSGREFGPRPSGMETRRENIGEPTPPMGPPGMEEPFIEPEKRPIFMEEQEKERSDYEIVDRLNLIEAQLSAIRSQTETINERLKNIETRLPRRY